MISLAIDIVLALVLALAVSLILLLVLALAVSLILLLVFDRRGPGPASGFLFFFLIAFLAIWAGGVWLQPIGPDWAGVSWLAFAVLAVVILLLLAAMLPPPEQPVKEGDGGVEQVQPAATVEVSVAFGVFFWVLLIVLLGAIALNYAISAFQETGPLAP